MWFNPNRERRRSAMFMRSLDSPREKSTRQKMREEYLSKPSEGENETVLKSISGVDLYQNRKLLCDVMQESFSTKNDVDSGIKRNRERVKTILYNIRQEQKAQFSSLIKNYYEKERRYDLMPTIRVVKKSKDFDHKLKMIKPLLNKGRISLPSTVKNTRLNKSVNYSNNEVNSKSKRYAFTFRYKRTAQLYNNWRNKQQTFWWN